MKAKKEKEKNRTEIAFTVRIMRKKLVMSISWNSFELVLWIAYTYTNCHILFSVPNRFLSVNEPNRLELFVCTTYFFFFVLLHRCCCCCSLFIFFCTRSDLFSSMTNCHFAQSILLMVHCVVWLQFFVCVFFLFVQRSCSEEITVIVSSLKYTRKKWPEWQISSRINSIIIVHCSDKYSFFFF